MHASPKPPGRFLPTLTEVVEPPSRPYPEPEPESSQPREQPTPDVEFDLVSDQVHINDLIERVMLKLEVTIRAQIVTVVNDLVNEQLSQMQPRLAQEVLLRLRESVMKTVRDEIHKQPSTTENDSPPRFEA